MPRPRARRRASCRLRWQVKCLASLWRPRPPVCRYSSRFAGCPRRDQEHHGDGQRTDRHQEIRQSPSLQHRHLDLRDARRPRPDGQRRRGFRRVRRQDRRGHHPLGPDPDHLRAGEQGGPEPPAGHVPAPAHPLLRRQHPGPRPELSRLLDRQPRPRPGEAARADDQGVRAERLRRPWASRCAQHGPVHRGHEDVLALSRRSERTGPERAVTSGESPATEGSDLDHLKQQMAEMQKKLEALSRK